MVKPRKRKPLKYDEVRFELDQMMTDSRMRRIEGRFDKVHGEHRCLLVTAVPKAQAHLQIHLGDYPKLQKFIRTKLNVLLFRDIIERFTHRSLRLHKVALREHLLSDYIRFRIRSGGCVSFDSGPDRKYKHITFGVPRAITK